MTVEGVQDGVVIGLIVGAFMEGLAWLCRNREKPYLPGLALFTVGALIAISSLVGLGANAISAMSVIPPALWFVRLFAGVLFASLGFALIPFQRNIS